MSIRHNTLIAKSLSLLPGLMLSSVIAMAASFISEHQGGPTLLYALLIGMAFHSITHETAASPGIAFTSRTILRIGVALLGARISSSQISSLGWYPIFLIMAGVFTTLCLGWVLAKFFKVSLNLGLLTGGSVAICGASAALAISAILPATPEKERDTLFTVVGVTVLSTIAMVAYPVFAQYLHLSADDAGFLFGATIHDVAQVVAAGQLISDHAALVATYTKLLRVALLLPVVFTLAAILGSGSGQSVRQLVPFFLVVFAALVLVNSLGFISPALAGVLAEISRWSLVCAIAALGMKTSLADLAKVGWRPMALLSIETLYLLGFISIGMALIAR